MNFRFDQILTQIADSAGKFKQCGLCIAKAFPYTGQQAFLLGKSALLFYHDAIDKKGQMIIKGQGRSDISFAQAL